jgi:hypothetical protein
VPRAVFVVAAGQDLGERYFFERHDPGCNFAERGGVGNVTAKHSKQS